jgi:small subunit ribosomal protein S16
MLKLRLSRCWKHKTPFYRIVLTEHTKPANAGYQDVVGWYNPLKHNWEANFDKIKEYIGNWAQPTERVAKLLYKFSNDESFKKYYTESIKNRKPKKEKK